MRRTSSSTVISEPDQGIYDALNKGVARSTGEIIAFLNSDDIYAANDVIASIAAHFTAYSLDAVYGDVAFIKGHDPDRIVRVYSSSGVLVSLLEHNSTTFGGSLDWNVRNRNNQVVASGVYFYHIEAGDARRVGRFTVVNFAQ